MSGGPRTTTDDELLSAAAGGDEDSFLEVYRRHRDRVWRFAYRMTGSIDAAADITHSCFASLLAAPLRYDGRRASLGTYLCTAARNLSLRHVSREWRERTAGDLLPDCTPASRPSALDSLLEDERARIVWQAVRSLAPLHREVLVLAEYDELDMAAIAAIVGAEVGTVKVRLHRARQKLRRALEPHWTSGALKG